MIQDIKQRVEEEIKTIRAAILSLGYLHIDALKGAELVGLFEDLAAQNEKLIADLKWFCDRVESGEVRSKRTYARFKETLKALGINPTNGDV